MTELTKDTMRNVRDNVKFLRGILDVSQQKMAKLTGVSRDLIWRMENISTEDGDERDLVYPSLQTLLKLCDYFEVPLQVILCSEMSSGEYSETLKKKFGRKSASEP